MSLLKQVTPAGIDCCCVWLPIAKVATRWVRKQAAAKAIQRSQSGSQSICGNLASDTSQNMTAAMPKNVKAGGMMLALLMAVVTFTAADCPDAGIRCRIPASDADTTVSTAACPHACSVRVLPKAAVCQPPLRIKGSSSGCSGGGSASGGATGDVPTGMISINGMCYNSETDSDQTTFAVIGDITGQCYKAIEGGCQPEHCPGNSAGLRCNQQVKTCTVNGQTECEGKKVSG